MEVLEINKFYRIIYDDKGYKPVQKIGKVISKEGTLFTLKGQNGIETLNSLNIIRMVEVEEWKISN